MAREEPVIVLGRHNCNIERVVEDGGERWLLRALRIPGGPLLHDLDADGVASPALSLRIDNQQWFRQPHLHRSRSFDPHYVVTIDNDGGAWLQFGDGRRGLELELSPSGDLSSARPSGDLEISYRVGDPLAGNCGLGRLSELVLPSQGSDPTRVAVEALDVQSVTNVVPGSGGRLADSLDAARLNIPASLRHGPLERAVTINDYARAAEQADPRVERAVARELGGAFSTIFVLVDERGANELSAELRSTLEAELARVRMVGREVIVRGPVYVPLDVELGICPEPGVDPHQLREAIYAALRPGTSERPGWFHPDRASFGQRLDVGKLLAHVHGLTGVGSVKALRFRRLSDNSPTPAFAQLEFEASEIPRLDGNESKPEHGRLRVRVHGLDRDIDLSTYATATATATAMEANQ